MNEHVAGLIRQYRNKGLLLDTVLFVLLAAGIYNRKLVGNDKRLKAYVPEDIETLIAFVKLFDPLITTPNTVTEVSNLTGHYGQHSFRCISPSTSRSWRNIISRLKQRLGLNCLADSG